MVWQKGQTGNPNGRGKGTKNKSTLLKEERRAIFDKAISQVWEAKIKELKAEYIADQFMGKAPDELIVRAPVLIDEDIAEKNEIISLNEKYAPPSTTKDNSKGQAQVQSIKVRQKIREDNADCRGD